MFEQYDYERLQQLQEKAEQGTIDEQMRPYFKWLANNAEEIQRERERPVEAGHYPPVPKS